MGKRFYSRKEKAIFGSKLYKVSTGFKVEMLQSLDESFDAFLTWKMPITPKISVVPATPNFSKPHVYE